MKENHLFHNNASISEWLHYIKNLDTKRNQSLFYVKKVARILKITNFCSSFVFTVTGTNGKGSTCTILERILLASNYKVGLYISPHLINYVERVRINGNILSEDRHISVFNQVEQARGSIPLTYFEFITLSSLLLFKETELDVIILEVGLGGRLDATNIIDSDLSIITNISIDHVDYLGSTREDIANEKAGIFRKKCMAIIGDRFVPISIKKIAKVKDTTLKRVGLDWDWKINIDSWDFLAGKYFIKKLPIPKLPICNVALALSALYFSNLIIDNNVIKDCIQSIDIPGRFQTINNRPRIILDVAHNPDSASFLSNQITAILPRYNKVHTVVGMLNDKDIKNTVQKLFKVSNFWYYAPLKSERSSNISILKTYLPAFSKQFNCIKNAFFYAKNKAKKNDIILVFGSFYCVSEVIQCFVKSSNNVWHIK